MSNKIPWSWVSHIVSLDENKQEQPIKNHLKPITFNDLIQSEIEKEGEKLVNDINWADNIGSILSTLLSNLPKSIKAIEALDGTPDWYKLAHSPIIEFQISEKWEIDTDMTLLLKQIQKYIASENNWNIYISQWINKLKNSSFIVSQNSFRDIASLKLALKRTFCIEWKKFNNDIQALLTKISNSIVVRIEQLIQKRKIDIALTLDEYGLYTKHLFIHDTEILLKKWTNFWVIVFDIENFNNIQNISWKEGEKVILGDIIPSIINGYGLPNLKGYRIQGWQHFLLIDDSHKKFELGQLTKMIEELTIDLFQQLMVQPINNKKLFINWGLMMQQQWLYEDHSEIETSLNILQSLSKKSVRPTIFTDFNATIKESAIDTYAQISTVKTEVSTEELLAAWTSRLLMHEMFKDQQIDPSLTVLLRKMWIIHEDTNTKKSDEYMTLETKHVNESHLRMLQQINNAKI